MKKGLYLLIGIFALMFLFSNFVSAGYCLGNIDCTGFGSDPTPPSYSTCPGLESENYCEWYDYSSCSSYDEYDCEMYDCTWDYYMEVCTSSNGECWPGSNNVDSCNNFDYSEYACEGYPGCIWESGCLNDADCGSGQYCSGESQYCSGTYTDKIGPGTANNGDDSLYRQTTGGVPKLCTLEYDQFDNPWYNCIWEEDIMYINFDGSSYDSCGICSDAGNLGYIVRGSTWRVHWCVQKTPLVFGQCVWGSRWSDNYDELGSGYITRNCGSSTCDLHWSCSWNDVYGTCETSCVAETNAVFCSRLGKECGSVTANDNCGDSKTVNCGTCTSPEICSSGVCGCTAKTCASLGIYNCGIWDDGCGGTVNCGTCTLPEICSSGLCECIADCDGKECGSDGCGGVCKGVDNGMSQACTATYGSCSVTGTETCVGTVFSLCSGTDPRTATCEAPVNCGSDGCGSVCGLCNLGETCTNGVCSCVPDCAGKECGDDGCEGTCPPGCGTGQDCVEGVCEWDPLLYWADANENIIVGLTETPLIPYTVKMILRFSGLPSGTNVDFEVYEDDGAIGDDTIDTFSGTVDEDGKAVVEWDITKQDLGKASGPLDEETSTENTQFEFYFKVIDITSYQLRFIYNFDMCEGVTLCSHYDSSGAPEADCWADPCGANATECLDYFCRCEWDDVGGTCNQVGYEEPDIFTNLCVWCIDDVNTRGTWCDMPEGTNDYCDTAEAGCGIGDSITNSIYCDAIDFTIGSCTYLTDDSGDLDGCEDDGYLTYTWGARWGWNEVANTFLPPDPDPDGSDFLEDPLGTWRYDPTLLSVDCNAKGGTNSAICPAQIELPFFGTWGIIITIGLIVLIYVVLNLKKKKVVAKKKGKKK